MTDVPPEVAAWLASHNMDGEPVAPAPPPDSEPPVESPEPDAPDEAAGSAPLPVPGKTEVDDGDISVLIANVRGVSTPYTRQVVRDWLVKFGVF